VSNASITIVGNLTADPELRFTKNGISVANVTIASTPRTFNKQTQAWEDGEALFLKGTVWKDLAEHVAESLTRGARVIATGKLVQRNWEKDGEKRSVVELEIEEIGPSLKYAKASLTKTSKVASNPDPWGNNDTAFAFGN
jgi:single-strand DNA-binding protein